MIDMMVTRFVLLAWMISGCATAPVVLPAGTPAEQIQGVEELRLPVEWRAKDGDGYGQILVELVDDLPNGLLGVAKHVDGNPCRPVIQLERQRSQPYVLAHEIGHELLLQHSPDAAHGLMYPEAHGQFELTEEQRYLMRAGAEALKACRLLRQRKQRRSKTVAPAPVATGSFPSPGISRALSSRDAPGGGAAALTEGT